MPGGDIVNQGSKPAVMGYCQDGPAVAPPDLFPKGEASIARPERGGSPQHAVGGGTMQMGHGARSRDFAPAR